jgi:hypothetical protein
VVTPPFGSLIQLAPTRPDAGAVFVLIALIKNVSLRHRICISYTKPAKRVRRIHKGARLAETMALSTCAGAHRAPFTTPSAGAASLQGRPRHFSAKPLSRCIDTGRWSAILSTRGRVRPSTSTKSEGVFVSPGSIHGDIPLWSIASLSDYGGQCDQGNDRAQDRAGEQPQSCTADESGVT